MAAECGWDEARRVAEIARVNTAPIYPADSKNNQ